MSESSVNRRRRLLVKAPAGMLPAAVANAVLMPRLARAQDARSYPDHPIRFVVPYPPGGLTDRVARVLGEKLQGTLGQPVVVDNRGGAGATIGSDFVAKSKPDGYTLLMGVNASHSVNVSLMKLPYDPIASFTPVSLMITVPNMLMVNGASPINTFEEFIQHAKANPGKVTYSSQGIGTVGHLGMEQLSMFAGLQMVHVPSSGPAQAITDVVSGNTEALIDSVATSMPLVKSGKLKAIAVTSQQRSPAAPQLPAIAQSGYPGFEVILWFALFAPAGLPAPLVARLNEEIRRAFADPTLSGPLVTDGLTIVTSSPEQLADFQRSEIAKYAKLVKAANIKTG